MPEIRVFSYLPVKIPHHRILKRLGYNSIKNEISARMMSEIDEYIEQTADLIELKAAVLRTSAGIVNSFNSEKLEVFLAGADQLILMGITGGQAVADKIQQLQLDGRMTEAVVVDAAAGEITDEGFSRIAEIYSRELIREGRILTNRRFSAGYGDFDIRHQQDIYRMLKLEKIDITITESSMLLPEKSVTAVYGIKGNENE